MFICIYLLAQLYLNKLLLENNFKTKLMRISLLKYNTFLDLYYKSILCF